MNAPEKIYIETQDGNPTSAEWYDFPPSWTDAKKYTRHDLYAAVEAERDELRREVKRLKQDVKDGDGCIARREQFITQLESERDQLRARLDAAMEWAPVVEADLPHVAIDLALLLRDGSWIQGDHDHGAFRSAMGRDVTCEVTHIMRIKPPAGGEKDS